MVARLGNSVLWRVVAWHGLAMLFYCLTCYAVAYRGALCQLNSGRHEVVDPEVVMLEVADSAVVSSWLCVGWAVAWPCCGVAWPRRVVLWHGMAIKFYCVTWRAVPARKLLVWRWSA